MKKLIYLAILLLGVGIIMNGCSGSGNKSGNGQTQDEWESEYWFTGGWRADDGSILFIVDDLEDNDGTSYHPYKGHVYFELKGHKWYYEECYIDDVNGDCEVDVPSVTFEGEFVNVSFLGDGPSETMRTMRLVGEDKIETIRFVKDPSVAKSVAKNIGKELVQKHSGNNNEFWFTGGWRANDNSILFIFDDIKESGEVRYDGSKYYTAHFYYQFRGEEESYYEDGAFEECNILYDVDKNRWMVDSYRQIDDGMMGGECFFADEKTKTLSCDSRRSQDERVYHKDSSLKQIMDKAFPAINTNSKSQNNLNPSNTSSKEDYSWIYGAWYVTTPYGTMSIAFNRNGTVTELSDGMNINTAKYGTYEINGNVISYRLNGEVGRTEIYIESGHKLSAGGGYYYKKLYN